MTIEADRMEGSRNELYRGLPSVNEILLSERVELLLRLHPRSAVVEAVRTALDGVRREIASGRIAQEEIPLRMEALPNEVEEMLQQNERPSLRSVINATGVLLHTNLGRAPLSPKAGERVEKIACGYSNLELNLESGERGKRDEHVEGLLLALMAESAGLRETHRAIVVNNCAAATYLALRALAAGREVLVSRGELVEIGGGFRIPEILEESGAVLREVGTTNRTRAADYEAALSPATAMILRVHQSNFSMEGFVERPALSELVTLGRRANVPVFADHGTGLIQPLESYGIVGELTMSQSLAAGCDLVAASGDKLLGGPQCGILVGSRKLVDRIRAHPLFRALRVDKMTYAALEATLLEYRCGRAAELPLFRMLAAGAEEIASRCRRVAESLADCGLLAEVVETESKLGGGTSPRTRVRSFAVALRHPRHGADEVLRGLRRLDPPVIGRIEEDRVLLDLRTVDPDGDDELMRALPSLRAGDGDL
jgi:L-seryl-tRNA(Ser) seleniumtransferase